MRAALITGREKIEYRDFPEPEPSAGAAVVRIERCGICGTDVSAYRSGRPYAPFLCGHEWTGTVVATGRDVRALRDGDRVVMGVPVACGRCGECRGGHSHRCAGIMALAYGIHPLTPPHGGYRRLDSADFPAWAKAHSPRGLESLRVPTCTAPIEWKRFDLVLEDLDAMRAAVAGRDGHPSHLERAPIVRVKPRGHGCPWQRWPVHSNSPL